MPSSEHFALTSIESPTITLHSFADLATALDLASLPPGPIDDGLDELPQINLLATTQAPSPIVVPDLDLLVAELARVGAALEAAVRADTEAREAVLRELVRYDALLVDRARIERTRAEWVAVREHAEQLVAEAFAEPVRRAAVDHLASARRAELDCTDLLAMYDRAIDDLIAQPNVQQALADRQALEAQRVAAAARAEAERAARHESRLQTARTAQRDGRLEEALELLTALRAEFPEATEIGAALDAVTWQRAHLRHAPAEEAVREVLHRKYRHDPAGALARLTAVELDGVPHELARRLFGLWSNACLQLVQAQGLLDPRRYSPTTSRGVVLARREADLPFEVVSVLGLPGWQVGTSVTASHILAAARPLHAR
jgi:hypothetical protein